MLQKLLYALKVVRQRGIGFFYTYFMESVWFDWKNGTSTSSRVPKDQQAIVSTDTELSEGLLYVASFTSVTQKTVAIARDLLGPARFGESQFLDMGCGKGKALLVFAQTYGGQTSHVPVGIEYDPGLADMARANAKKCGLGSDKMSVVADSATNVRGYITSPTPILYLYNSFQGETLRTVLSELSTLPHVLIYVDPAERHILADYGYTIVAENTGKYNADTWLVARSGLEPA